ncbi:interleukin-17C [Brienomyrus brachyistius]|uniref:interleukin-17C n=1 Tax=Brienomyrus brachyistius TaxID=42636 RepID=UPI0020B24CC6|nr:interleukin-17C [Brienomyrus brachyistius]
MLRVLLYTVLLLTLNLSKLIQPKKHKGCFTLDEMKHHAKKFLRKNLRLPPESFGHPQQDHLARDFCSSFKLQPLSTSYSNRSISPWRYRMDHDEARYPSGIAFAECLCDGCIINGSEDTSYNSVVVKQTRMVLKRTRCPQNPDRYSFESMFLDVPVACTCVIPPQ